MTAAPGRLRLFVALDLPAPVRGALRAWGAAQAAGNPALRALRREDLHVTLCFLGGREEAQAEHIGALLGACAAPVPGLALGAPAWLPERRPRIIAVDVADERGALASLQERVSRALATEAGYEPETRPFRPHVTVARVRGGARVPTEPLSMPPVPGFAGTALTLYRSHLSRSGARYEALLRVALGA